ncbi:hypothetical protein Tco_0963371 [Tanacetum coccineum]
MSVELNMWHQVGMTHRSIFAAAWKIFRWSSGSLVSSYVFTLIGMRVLFGTSKFQICAVNGSVSSHNHGWERSSSSFDLRFLDFQCPPWSWSFFESYSSLLRVSSLTSFLLWLGVSADLPVLLYLLVSPCRGAFSGPGRECMSLFLSPNRAKTFLSLRPSLLNTVALTGLLWRVGLSLSRLSLENALADYEGRVPLDAMTGLCPLFLGLLFLSHDFDSENCVCEFHASFRRKSGAFVGAEVFPGEPSLP